jgi:hypothetical protein
MASTSIESIENPERLKKKLTGQPVLHQRRRPSLVGRGPCCCATSRPSLLIPSCALAIGGPVVSPAPINGYRLDYLKGQGRLMRPPRDGSLRIHPSSGPSGRTIGTDSESLVLAVLAHLTDTGMVAGHPAPAQPELSLTRML